MRNIKIPSSMMWWLGVSLLPFIYFWLYAPYGFEDKDTGFILGNSWQVLKGAKLYTDILYIRPPGSILFHLLSFCAPNGYVLLLDRLLFYFEIFGYSLLSVNLLGQVFRICDSRHLAFMTALSFVLSAHNFPPMAWHTVDGLFFCTIGLTLIFYKKTQAFILPFLGGMMLAWGVLCKQSFYLMPFGVLVYLLLNKKRSELIYALAGFLAVFTLFGIWLVQNEALQAFCNLTTGQTKVSDLVSIGVYSHIDKLDKLPLVFGPPLFVAILAMRYAKIYVREVFFFILYGWVSIYMLTKYYLNDTFSSPPGSFPNVLFIGVLFYATWKWVKERSSRYLLCLLLLLLAWSASISWGYPSVVLFSAPVVFVLALLLRDSFSLVTVRAAAAGLLVLFIATFWVGYQNPYTLDHPGLRRNELCYDMGRVYPRLAGIFSDRRTYEEYIELRQMIQRYGDKFTILPSCTLAHFITDTRNPIGSDWVMNAEINGEERELNQRLEKHCPVVFVERRELSSEGRWRVPVAIRVVQEWQKVEAGKYFDVFKQ